MDDSTQERHETRATRALASHILPNSGTMIGVCTTLIGLVKILENTIGPSRVDEFVALVGVLFLGSAILSYLSIRNIGAARFSRRCENAADTLFLVGLVAIVVLAVLFAFEAV